MKRAHLEDSDHFTARLAPAAGAHLALRPPSIWTLLIGLRPEVYLTV